MVAREVKKCPRCDGFIPNNEKPGEYPGALSRTDNSTEICSECGTREAWEQFAGLDRLSGEPLAWWVKQRGDAWFAGTLKQ